MIVRGYELVVHLSGCRMGCKKMMADCMYGCLANPGKKMHVGDVLATMRQEKVYGLKIEGTESQKLEFHAKIKRYLDDFK